MWERAELKQRAKSVLATSYWKAFLVSIVMGVATNGVASSGSRGANFDGVATGHYSPEALLGIFIIAAIVFIIAIGIASLIRILAGYHLEVGGTRYFIRAAKDDINMGHLGYGFRNGHYSGIIKTMFWKGLKVFLWTLLLIIPGIIKRYAYMMVPYILAENPNIGSKRALELSDQMTKGHKLDIFILHLSFFWWYLLGMLACLVGMIFVVPYHQSTLAELYLVLRDDLIQEGRASEEEFNIEKNITILDERVYE